MLKAIYSVETTRLNAMKIDFFISLLGAGMD
jgi:hypothetical protein